MVSQYGSGYSNHSYICLHRRKNLEWIPSNSAKHLDDLLNLLQSPQSTKRTANDQLIEFTGDAGWHGSTWEHIFEYLEVFDTSLMRMVTVAYQNISKVIMSQQEQSHIQEEFVSNMTEVDTENSFIG